MAVTCLDCSLGLADDYVTTKLSLQSPKSRVGVSRENLDHHDEDLCRGWHSPAWIALWALRMIALPQRNYAEEATKVAQKQYSSLLEGLRAVGQVKGWQTQQIVFVGGTCGSVHATVESFNKNMKALGVLESKWNPIRQKLVRD